MGQMDITEKLLEDYNDVFADIVNVLIFAGERRIKEKDLFESRVRSQYKVGTKLHEEERDVAKFWRESGVEIALCGLENQTRVEKFMPFRVIGYDGAAYREQLLDTKRMQIVPVVTLILYFGIDSRWKQPKCLKELLDIPKGMEDFVNDYKINVFEISWLEDDIIEKFQSDFRIVASYFKKKRTIPGYIPNDPTEIDHVDAVLKLFAALTGDDRYVLAAQESDGKEIRSMCDVIDRVEKIGIEKGIEKGIKKGIEKGESRIVRNMRANGASIEEIVRLTGVQIDTVKGILDNRIDPSADGNNLL